MAVRLDAASEALLRTANLPAWNAFSVCGWARVVADTGGDYQWVVQLYNSGGDDSVGLAWEHGGGTVMRTDYFVDGAGGTDFAGRPAVGTDFFFALTGNGTNYVGYYREAGQNALTSASVAAVNPGTFDNIHFLSSFFDERISGRVWNVKVWNRALTAAELLIEGYYRRLQFPSSINFHCTLDRHTDLSDYGGLARALSSSGTLSTEDGVHGLARPRRRIFIPAPAAGGSFNAAWARGANIVMQPGR